MKVTVQRNILLKPLQFVTGGIERKQVMPILSNVLLRTTDNNMDMVTSDTEMELMGKLCPDLVERPGTATVSARKLLDICRALPENAVIQIEEIGNRIILHSGRSRFQLATLPASEFPCTEKPAFDTCFRITHARLRQMLADVHFSMGHQDVRHYLNGTLMDIGLDLIKCVATDGHRLAFSQASQSEIVSKNSPGTPVTPTRVIVPRKTVMELMRLPESVELVISIGKQHFRVEGTDFMLTSSLIPAQYPDYERLIPRQIRYAVAASRDFLRQALIRASILSGEKFRGVCLTLGQECMRIVANNTEQELAEEIIPLEYTGEECEMAFNVAYLLDILSVIPSEKIRWSFNDPQSGILIEPVAENKTEKNSLYVVMPMRL